MRFAKKIAESLVTKLGARHAGAPAGGASESDARRALLEHWVRAPTTPQRVVLRSLIVLSALEGVAIEEIARRVNASPSTVRLWTTRYEEAGPEALLRDAPGRGRHAAFTPEVMETRLRQANLVTAEGLPVSIRRAAKFLGVSTSTVWRAIRKTRQRA